MADISILGHGFLGGSLVDDLLGPQHEIQVLCRTSPAHGAAAGVNYVYGDAGDRTAIEAVIRTGLTVFAIGSTFPALSSDQLQAFAAREKRLLDLALQVTAEKAGRFVYISSSAIYGEVSTRGARETDFPSPTSLYGQHKLACEQFCLEHSQKHSLPVTILRLSNPYGPRQISERCQGLIGIVLENLRHNRPTIIRGNGSAIRDYVPVAVLSAVVSRLAANSFHFHNAPTILNVCSGVGLSTREVLNRLSIWLGQAIPIQQTPSVAGEIQRSVLDPNLLIQLVPDLPDASFSAGLAAFTNLKSIEE
jgi:UDP-glucose 4-epimerase